MTALMFAVKVGSLDVVKLLAERSTALFAMNSVSMINIHGTQPPVKGLLNLCILQRDETVLEMAKNSSPEIQQYLLEKYKVSDYYCRGFDS
jgi:hypothetical protein